MEFKITFLVADPYHFDSRTYLPFEEMYSIIPIERYQKIQEDSLQSFSKIDWNQTLTMTQQ